MLEAYAKEPDAFTSTVEEREPLPLEWWAARISEEPDTHEFVFGAFVDENLVGLAGLMLEQRQRTSHKAILFGMYLQPPYRGRGIAKSLVEAVVAHAAQCPGTTVIQLTVTDTNAPAIKLYASCGFQPFGTEPFAINVGGRFVSKVHMWRPVGENAA